jgi:hypothetical protein
VLLSVPVAVWVLQGIVGSAIALLGEPNKRQPLGSIENEDNIGSITNGGSEATGSGTTDSLLDGENIHKILP